MEEDIKILEIFLKNMKKDKTYSSKGFYKHLENLLKRYKELEEKETEKFLKVLEDNSKTTLVKEVMELRKENEQYKKQFEDIKCNILVPSITEKNFIPISVIQNKINGYLEYDEKYKTCTKDGRRNYTLEYFKAKALQELLEERNK